MRSVFSHLRVGSRFLSKIFAEKIVGNILCERRPWVTVKYTLTLILLPLFKLLLGSWIYTT